MANEIKTSIDKRLSEITVSSLLEKQIMQKTVGAKTILVELDLTAPRKRKIRRPLFVLLAACMCLVLSVTVMAATGVIDEVVSALTKGPLTEDLAPLLGQVEAYCTDNGIKMNMVGALASGDSLIVVFTLEDIEQSRIPQGINPPRLSVNDNSFHLGHTQVAYDPETKTATIAYIFILEYSSEVTLSFNELEYCKTFTPINTSIDLAAVGETDKMKYVGNLSYGNGYCMGGPNAELVEELLQKGELPLLIPSDEGGTISGINYARISGIGYIDGQLHIQLYYFDDIDETGVSAWLSLIFSENNKLTSTEYEYSLYDENLLYSCNFSAQLFGKAGTMWELVYDISPKALVSNNLFAVSDVFNIELATGKWKVSFAPKVIDPVEVACSIKVGASEIKNIWVSPFCFKLKSSGNPSFNKDDMVIEITMENGTVKRFCNSLAWDSSFYFSEGRYDDMTDTSERWLLLYEIVDGEFQIDGIDIYRIASIKIAGVDIGYRAPQVPSGSAISFSAS